MKRFAVFTILISFYFVTLQQEEPRRIELSQLNLEDEVYAPILLANTVGVGYRPSTVAANYTTIPAYVSSPDGGYYQSNPAYYTSPNNQNLMSNPAYYTSVHAAKKFVAKECTEESPETCESPIVGGLLKLASKNGLHLLPAPKSAPLPKLGKRIALVSLPE